MIRRLYDRTLQLSEHPHALRWLGVVSFAESSFFPIPPDVMLIPMIVAQRAKAWLIATVCTVASVLGGLAGYALGFFAFAAVGQPVMEFYGYGEKFTEFTTEFNEYGAWIVFVFGITPFPYKVITIASGVTQLDVLTFMMASTLSRGIRFYLEAALLWYFGPPVRAFIEKRLEWVVTVAVILLIGGFVAVSYL
ncbi:MAG: YqaA family protein [Alphaproteobacteria bacterium]